MSQFNASTWTQAENCQHYRDTADHYIVERQTLLRILASFHSRFLGVGRSHRVLDLGCGDGILGATVLAVDPSIRLIEVDGSEEMLAAARRRLAGHPQAEYCQRTFQEIITSGPPWTGLDLVVSAFAVHHLEHPEKLELFRKIFAMLRAGGCFINLDVVRPDSAAYEDWFYELWAEWIAERQQRLRLAQDFSRVPAEGRNRPENKYELLGAQLQMLREAGFADVDCFYRYGLFGIYGGRKP